MHRKTWGLIATVALASIALGQSRDPDTLSLDEVQTAAAEKFDRLDTDADHTLDAAEVRGVISERAFKAADSNNDGTLDKDEYLALVDKLFNRADVDHDGQLNVRELKGPNGRMIGRLLR